MGSIPGSGRFPERRHGNQLQYSCLESHGQRSLVGYSPQGHKELDMTEMTWHTQMNGYVLYKDIICGIGTTRGRKGCKEQNFLCDGSQYQLKINCYNLRLLYLLTNDNHKENIYRTYTKGMRTKSDCITTKKSTKHIGHKGGNGRPKL